MYTQVFTEPCSLGSQRVQVIHAARLAWTVTREQGPGPQGMVLGTKCDSGQHPWVSV